MLCPCPTLDPGYILTTPQLRLHVVNFKLILQDSAQESSPESLPNPLLTSSHAHTPNVYLYQGIYHTGTIDAFNSFILPLADHTFLEAGSDVFSLWPQLTAIYGTYQAGHKHV